MGAAYSFLRPKSLRLKKELGIRAVLGLLRPARSSFAEVPDSVYVLARGRFLSNHFRPLRFQRLKIGHERHKCLGWCLY